MDALFKGLRVIDCATVIAAPAAAMMLGSYGADVIKIEAPPDGDMLRMLSDIPTTPDGYEDWFWQLDGRHKRCLTLDLKTQEGAAILRKLVATADVFITNHPQDVRRALGLTWDDLCPLNDRLIYASLTAYGELGPEADRRGFDQLAYWARSGLMEMMREPETMPTQGLPGMGDHPTAVALYASIVTALLARAQTGKGTLVHTSLLANGLWSAAGIAQGAMAGGDIPEWRARNRVQGATYRPYQTADNRWLQFNMVRTEELLSLAFTAMDALHLLVDERFSTLELMFEHREALGNEIQAVIGTQSAEHWHNKFTEYNVPVNLVATVEETVTDPQVHANAMITGRSDLPQAANQIINHPIQVAGLAQTPASRAAALGEHSEEILQELGYAETEISELLARGITSTPP